MHLIPAHYVSLPLSVATERGPGGEVQRSRKENTKKPRHSPRFLVLFVILVIFVLLISESPSHQQPPTSSSSRRPQLWALLS